MAIKHWIREGGKGYFIGPEEDMYHETDQECPPRPSEDHVWKDGSWQIDLQLQRENRIGQAYFLLEEVKHWHFLEADTPEEEAQRKKYLSDLAKVKAGKSQDIPQKPKFME